MKGGKPVLTYMDNDDLSPVYETENETSNTHVCSVCEREIYNGEACYCFEGSTVCENCCSAYVIDHYWYASPADIANDIL